jgi:A/G-specific adenine glycosylase
MKAARVRLLRWFDTHARDLPWRRTRDPYAIWVSEVMLQQTRVETVIPYYERFVARFGTVTTLASATEDAVLSHWSGLGYYRRARQLHAAAKVMLAEHDGQVPRDREARRALPGIGAYTAGAIGSIAFDLCEPIVDGNVARVLSRVHGIDAPLGSKASEVALWEHAQRWVEGERPGVLNQALMELGATLCAKSAPRCDECPLRSSCVAHREDRIELLPVPKARRAPTEIALVAVRAKHGGKFVLVRSDVELFGGLYGLPSEEIAACASKAGRRAAAARALAAAELVASGPFEERGEVVHVLTHRRMTVSVWEVEVKPVKRGAPGRAMSPEQLGQVGISTLTKRLLAR